MAVVWGYNKMALLFGYRKMTVTVKWHSYLGAVKWQLSWSTVKWQLSWSTVKWQLSCGTVKWQLSWVTWNGRVVWRFSQVVSVFRVLRPPVSVILRPPVSVDNHTLCCVQNIWSKPLKCSRADAKDSFKMGKKNLVINSIKTAERSRKRNRDFVFIHSI